jgi:hypothetical protein
MCWRPSISDTVEPESLRLPMKLESSPRHTNQLQVTTVGWLSLSGCSSRLRRTSHPCSEDSVKHTLTFAPWAIVVEVEMSWVSSSTWL